MIALLFRPTVRPALTRPEIEVGPFLAERYPEVAADGAAELREALEVIAASDRPVVFHRASGKPASAPGSDSGTGT
ncbi:tyrosine-protein phosphatase [Streptomyces marianii]|uniref:tyrosine-protein phosphatase n=1 Tax=Streptomyces marianii TaxID=1817406 RepID=UPI001F43090C|nr:tyrosine-protein phosphatase [Streptomyces marianii]